MKVSKQDLLAILKRFEIAGNKSTTRLIDQVKSVNPSPTNQVVSFRFERKPFFILLDDEADDSIEYITDELRKIDNEIEGELVVSPISDIHTYSLPFKGKSVYLFNVKAGKNRLDVRLARENPDLSRSTWQKHIKAGRISVNGNVITDTKYEVGVDAVISADLENAPNYDAHDLPIIYLDENIIVINKPAGILTHSKGELNEEFTVADFFRRYTKVGLDTNRPGIVHRLDRDTSGVIVGARTPESFDIMKKQFAKRLAKKTYIAIVDGVPKINKARIDIPIGRNPKAPSTFKADAKGKPAITDYEVSESDGKCSLVTIKPKTGRTHQIRVHMAHLGTPVHGDRVYGKSADRLYLHAHRLELTVAPEQHKMFTAPLPAEFEKYTKKSSSSDVHKS